MCAWNLRFGGSRLSPAVQTCAVLAAFAASLSLGGCTQRTKSPTEGGAFINNGAIPSYQGTVGVPFDIPYHAQYDAAASVPAALATVTIIAGGLRVECRRAGDGSIHTTLLGGIVNIITLECIDPQGGGG